MVVQIHGKQNFVPVYGVMLIFCQHHGIRIFAATIVMKLITLKKGIKNVTE
jgi:hypothetical protein